MTDHLEDAAGQGWEHCRPFEPHPAQPDLSRAYRQRGTGVLEAPCKTCGNDEAVVLVEEWKAYVRSQRA